MNRNLSLTPKSRISTNLHFCTSASLDKSKESTNNPIKSKELFSSELNNTLLKLCSDADMRIKVLLSNRGSEIKSSISKNSTNVSLSEFNILSKPGSIDPTPDSISFDIAKCNAKKSSNLKIVNIKSSIHFNTEINLIDDTSNKQITVLKIVKLRELARKIEKRQKTMVKHQFQLSTFQRNYVDGLQEGIRYGYFDNPFEEYKTQTEITEKTDSSSADNDKVIPKEGEELQPEMKESQRMRAGFQDPAQKESRLQNQDTVSRKTKKGSKAFNEVNQSSVTIINQFPTKCTEDMNIESFNKKYGIKTDGDRATDYFDVAEREQQYLQYFEKMLNSLGRDFSKCFRAGFRDGFTAANIFVKTDVAFSEDEQQYVSIMRKCLKFVDINLDNDVKNLFAFADEMKKKLNIPKDEFDDILYLIRKEMVKKVPLKFSRNDYEYYIDGTKTYNGNKDIKSSYEDNSEVFTSYDGDKSICHDTNNRALMYLKKHRINEFFQFLGSHLVASKPDDPISFLINLLDTCLEYRFNEYDIQAPLLFTRKHVESVYFVLDPMLTGFIDFEQYMHGMEALGLRDASDLSNSFLRTGEKIEKYVFVTNACHLLLRKFREMIAIDTISAIPSKVAYDFNTFESDSNI